MVILATNPPLVVDGCETRGGLVANVDKPQNFPPAGGKKSAKTLFFECFRANGATKFFRPSAEKIWLRNKGGLVARITTDLVLMCSTDGKNASRNHVYTPACP